MLKLLGIALIITATSMGGFYYAKGYSERPKQLRILQQALQMLETEIVYGSIPLDQAMKNIGVRLNNSLSKLFNLTSINLQELDGASTFECWDLAITEVFHETALKNEDKDILTQFGKTLGVSDREDQTKHIKLAIENLKTEEILAREEQRKYEKLSKNLGVLLGFLIAILIY